MNLAVRPFDDVHVRRAMNLAIVKRPLVEMIAHPPYGLDRANSGEVATHLAPDDLEEGLLQDRDFYPSDVAKAKEEMRQSVYDRNGDGSCDVPECRGIQALVMRVGVVPAMARAIAHDLDPLGIRLDLDVLPYRRFFRLIYDPAQRVPIGIVSPWGKDLPIGDGWFSPLFASGGLGGTNTTMLGASAGELRRWGYLVTSVPSIDDRVQACAILFGRSQSECWAKLDAFMMQKVVPWVPILGTTTALVVSGRVAAFSFDQFASLPALDRLALTTGPSSPDG